MIGPPFRRPAGLRSTGLPLWPSDGSEYRRELDRRTVYLGSDPLQLIETGAWHAEPVRAAHHRRIGFLFGLVAGIVVTLILTGAGRVAASSAARVIPASSFRAVEADPQESRTREQPEAPEPILDPATPTQLVERPAVAPTAELHVVSKAPVAGSGPSASGIASYYAWHPGEAAAGPALRVGEWRGRVVTVCTSACVAVRLTDWCQCYGSRVIDLDSRSFAALAPLSAGLVSVRVSW